MAKKPVSVSSGVRRGPKPSRSAGRSALVLKTAKPPGKSPVSVTDESSPDPVSRKGVPFPVVGIGASAGGFEAVTSLLKHLPTDTGMAFVVGVDFGAVDERLVNQRCGLRAQLAL